VPVLVPVPVPVPTVHNTDMFNLFSHLLFSNVSPRAECVAVPGPASVPVPVSAPASVRWTGRAEPNLAPVLVHSFIL
jgi:hypothetical protein